MLQEVALGQKSLSDYTHIAGKPLVERIRELAKELEGQRVLHVSATAFGGGVSEILYTIVPLMRDVGLDAHWHVIFGKEEFFNATKLLHNSLQGAEETLTDEQWEVFDEINEIPKRYPGVDLALLHLGGTRVLGVLVTMDDEQGVQMMQIVQPRVAIPIHYNDYDVFKSPLEDFKRAAAEAGFSDRLVYLTHGETYEFKVGATSRSAEM